MAERYDRHRAGIAVGLFALVLLLGALTQFVPRLVRHGDVTSSTPVRSDLAAVHPIALAAGARACIGQVTFDPAVRTAQLTLAPPPEGSAPARLTVTAAAPGYRSRATVATARDQAGPLVAPLAAPRDGAIGTLCVRNDGRRPVTLAGTGDPRALVRSAIVVDGVRTGEAFSVTLREAGGRSLLERTSQLVERTAALSAVGPWLVWLLIPLLLLGVPAAVGVALRLALSEPDPPRADPDQPIRPAPQ